MRVMSTRDTSFQLTAAQRRLLLADGAKHIHSGVSTHSRPKAAACAVWGLRNLPKGFNSQPPKGGCAFDTARCLVAIVSTHSRPKAAALHIKIREKSVNY